MDHEATKKLTPEEAGALVAQWAETHSVTAEDLGQKLGIDSGSLDSLLNQARGRLSMEKWSSQKKPTSRSNLPYASIAAAGAACLLIGGLLGHFLYPRWEPVQANQRGRGMTETRVAGPKSLGLLSGLVALPGPGAGGRTVPMPTSTGRIGTMFGPRSNLMTIGGERNVVVYPVNDGTTGSRIHIPDDVVLWVRTPAALFASNGRVTGNQDHARSLVAENFLPGLQELMADALRMFPPSTPTNAIVKLAKPEIVLRIGTVSTHLLIHWDVANKNALQSMFAKPITKDAKDILLPFLASVRHSGRALFAQPQSPAKMGTIGFPHPPPMERGRRTIAAARGRQP